MLCPPMSPSSRRASRTPSERSDSLAASPDGYIYHADRDKGKCDLHGGTGELTVEWEDQSRPLGYLYESGFIRTIARLPLKTRKQEPDNKDRNYQPKYQLRNALAVNRPSTSNMLNTAAMSPHHHPQRLPSKTPAAKTKESNAIKIISPPLP